MKKKYIIELNPDCVEGEYLRIPARIAGEEQWLVTKAALTPYTEPDLEQVGKEAYAEGFKDGQYAERSGLVANYAQEQETIQVGDEVELKCGVRHAIYMQGTKGSDEIYLLFNDGSCGLHSKSEIERKTGRHFHEIATILENMRGEQDGET